jgi:hypothetical protein
MGDELRPDDRHHAQPDSKSDTEWTPGYGSYRDRVSAAGYRHSCWRLAHLLSTRFIPRHSRAGTPRLTRGWRSWSLDLGAYEAPGRVDPICIGWGGYVRLSGWNTRFGRSPKTRTSTPDLGSIRRLQWQT